MMHEILKMVMEQPGLEIGVRWDNNLRAFLFHLEKPCPACKQIASREYAIPFMSIRDRRESLESLLEMPLTSVLLLLDGCCSRRARQAVEPRRQAAAVAFPSPQRCCRCGEPGNVSWGLCMLCRADLAD